MNGGSKDPSGLGFDVVDGKIVAIGDNVRVWISPGDTPPTCSDPNNQIVYYNKSNASSDKAGENYSDIFVLDVNNNSDVSKVQGNKITSGEGYKDYIFLVGAGEDYRVEASDPNNGHLNELTAIAVYGKESGNMILGSPASNHIEGIIYGDGLSPYPGDTEATWTLKFTLDIQLDSPDDAESLTQVTLEGLPEGATFTNGDPSGSVTVTYENGVYTLTFPDGTSGYKGTMTVTVPDGQQDLGDITMNVETTIDGDHQSEFIFDGDEGMAYDSEAEGIDMHSADMPVSSTDESDVSTQSSSHDESTENTDPSLQANAEDDPQEVNEDNLLIDTSQLSLDSVLYDTAQLTPDSETDSLQTLLGDQSETGMGKTTMDTDPAATQPLETEQGVLSQEEPLNFNDLLHNEGNQNLSDLIQTPEELARVDSQQVQHVPAEGGDAENSDVWAVSDESQVDHLIAKPESES